ncbi:UDP-glucose 6-dehydrogenase [Poriferisphaera corsica]|uniref:UDP-glucose 6-dehydrogenase n=1 Tax=Poriferisphaera corsica TaxID=2528020 RepID=A0A517YSA4_9BACT|nr:UDP-glucose/GDP-mannose dehydrogenase family protein [Poriferisphaera corsica]QDU33094.1 UDP-glucose 6-dehydrogenase [Poriferisphaera corsica]
MRITMVGTGYVGLVTGTCFANTGNQVTCLDIDQSKIEKLNNGISPIYEPGLDELIGRNAKASRLHFTTDKSAAYKNAEIIFIAVGTPSGSDGRANLQYVLAAAQDIGDAIEASSDTREKIIVVKSTVPVGTNIKVQQAVASRTSKTFHMASNPEFLKEGAAINDFNKPDRVVIGAHTKYAADKMRDLYEPFVRQGNPIFIMDIPSAEMVKYASNCMLATKISFINEVANLCEQYGADISEVRRGMCSDKRIGNQFLYPGLGYGGSCFPKDVLAMISMGQDCGHPAELLESVHRVNQQQRDVFLTKLESHFEGADWSKLKIAVWGIAFKPGTDDVREAPSITLIQKLLEKGATVTAYDPVAHETAGEVLTDSITYANNAIEAINDADALIVCTDWSEFKNPEFELMKDKMATPVIFDGRNVYRRSTMREYGFVYHSVGRAPINEENAAV